MFDNQGLRSLIRWSLIALTVMLTAAACSNGSGDSLVVYSGRSESLVGPIIDQFAEATGVDVSVKYGSTSEVAATLLEEGERSPADGTQTPWHRPGF